MATSGVSWSIVVPVKRLAAAKTRLAVPPALRAELAVAMALDTVAAALASPQVLRVVAVSDDERATPLLRDLGADVVADEPDAGLNPALVHGAGHAARSGDGPVAALASDLPALRPAALSATLERASAVKTGCVADASGSGTTLLTALSGADFTPAFGAGSWERHLAAGATDLTASADESLRRDVDTLADLRAALALGCGSHTASLLERHPRLLV